MVCCPPVVVVRRLNAGRFLFLLALLLLLLLFLFWRLRTRLLLWPRTRLIGTRLPLRLRILRPPCLVWSLRWLLLRTVIWLSRRRALTPSWRFRRAIVGRRLIGSIRLGPVLLRRTRLRTVVWLSRRWSILSLRRLWRTILGLGLRSIFLRAIRLRPVCLRTIALLWRRRLRPIVRLSGRWSIIPLLRLWRTIAWLVARRGLCALLRSILVRLLAGRLLISRPIRRLVHRCSPRLRARACGCRRCRFPRRCLLHRRSCLGDCCRTQGLHLLASDRLSRMLSQGLLTCFEWHRRWWDLRLCNDLTRR